MNKQLVIDVKLDSIKSSNLFLRKLWAEFRKIPGFHSSSSPCKLSKEKKITLGVIRFNQNKSCGVTIQYERRGIIQKIEFNWLKETDQALVRQMVELALNEYEDDIKLIPMTYFFRSSSIPIAPYKLKNFSIETLEDNYNVLKVESEGYEKIDAMTFSKFRLNALLDIIASQTLSSFYIVKPVKNVSAIQRASIKDNLYADDLEIKEGWHFGEHENQFYLSKELLNIVDHIFSSRQEDQNLIKLLSACKLFHSGLKLEAVDIQNNSSFNEISHTMYISALEVLASMIPQENKTCDLCGNVQYKIAQRVRDLVSRKTSNESLVKYINLEYGKRSKFLHTGQFFSKENFIGYHIPQLSKNDSSGNELQHNLSDTTRSMKVFLRHCILDELKKISG